nr:class I SAM-dependent methyltransferase [Chitinophagaceae bacterium]
MQDSSNDIYLNGEYFKNNPVWDAQDAPWKVAIIHEQLQKNNIRTAEVIEIGCGAGANLVELARTDQSIKKLTGYDISPQAIDLAAKNSTDRIQYFNKDLLAEDEISTDLLLVIDVVEHVDDYYGFLRKLRPKARHF